MSMIEAIKVLQSSGPYAIIVFMAIAYLRKDKQFMDEIQKNQQISQQLIDVVQEKTAADNKLESAITGLRDVIMALSGKL